MGYYVYTHMMYGVELTEIEAKELYEASTSSDPSLFYIPENCEYEIELKNNGTHSSLHNTSFEPGYKHYFGVILTKKSEDMTKVMRLPPLFLDELFEAYILPILEKNNIFTSPAFHIVTQTL